MITNVMQGKKNNLRSIRRLLGVDLCNDSYNKVLRLKIPEATQVINFAVAKMYDQAKEILEVAIHIIFKWLKYHGLEPVTNKTEVIVLSVKQKKSTLSPLT